MASRRAVRELLARLQNQNLRPHELDGDVFPEGQTEFDATETLPNPLDSLQDESPATNPLSILDNVIIVRGGQLVGRQITVAPQTPVTNPVHLFDLRAEDGLNSMFSVTIAQLPEAGAGVVPGFGRLEGPSNANQDESYAVISWGAGGVQYSTVVDVLPGQVFTVGGSFLRIRIVNRSHDGANYQENEFGAFVSLLPKGSQKHSAHFTEQMVLNVGIASLRSFPPFVKSMKLMRSPFTADVLVEFLDQGGVAVAAINVPASVDPPEFPVPGTASTYRITNGAVLARIQAIFSLDL